jgi:hypothetical protein
MAWRLNRHVIEGELDNTKRGRVTGWISFVGVANNRVTFDLRGDFHRDIRGAKLRLTNPRPVKNSPKQREDMQDFATHQTGVVGDMTAGLPPQDYVDYPYLEWYSDQNGRVVVELEPQQVEVMGTPLACEKEKPVSRKTQARSMGRFLSRLASHFKE